MNSWRFKIKSTVAVLGATMCLATAAQAITLDGAVQAALQDNPDIQVVVKEKLADESRVRETRANFFPRVDFETSFGRQYTEDSGTRANAVNTGDDNVTLSPSAASLSLRQMVFDGFETFNLVDQSLATSQAATYRLRAQAEQISLDVSQSYLEVIRQSRIAQLARGNVNTHIQYMNRVKERSNTGVGASADVAQAESRLGAAQNVLTEVLSNLRDAVASYGRLVGEDPDKLIRPKAPLAELPASLQLAIEKSLANNPSIMAAERDLNSSFYQAEVTKSPFLPRFDVELDARRSNDIEGVDGKDTDLRALLVMRYNLYNGGADTARQRTAIFERSRSQSVLDRVRRLVEEETKFAWHQMMASRDQIDTSKSVVRSNVSVRNAYLEQFELGQRSLLDLLDAENELFVSRIDLIDARFDALFSSYRVLAATGEMLDTLQVTMPEHFMKLASQ